MKWCGLLRRKGGQSLKGREKGARKDVLFGFTLPLVVVDAAAVLLVTPSSSSVAVAIGASTHSTAVPVAAVVALVIAGLGKCASCLDTAAILLANAAATGSNAPVGNGAGGVVIAAGEAEEVESEAGEYLGLPRRTCCIRRWRGAAGSEGGRGWPCARTRDEGRGREREMRRKRGREGSCILAVCC